MDRVIWTKTKSRGDGSPKSESYPHAKKGMHTGWGGGGGVTNAYELAYLD
jgi:hypothetical protein